MEDLKYAKWLKKIAASGVTESLGLGSAPSKSIALWCYRALRDGAHIDDVREVLRFNGKGHRPHRALLPLVPDQSRAHIARTG